ncbi:HTH arsR-type domain-containing protein OS=Streptomyces aurantiogriseus OX=66870 GN=GCM10010251_89220 PE=4 SV=1 [Streptomyces aurantiogriseus]|uniref:ArsR family transcriptional regulator n=1 Tax=Streptomyces aurantiogriseus TaxID=66870 RepID=A0A918FN95_9ACTN|nr:hypothetical protein GCM10010251_89220 [Streptomyces aurantiogriseus]
MEKSTLVSQSLSPASTAARTWWWVHAPGWHPVVQYPVAEPNPPEPVSLETVGLRLKALAHPVRLRLLRTLARGPHTSGEPAHAWELTPPEVSRHLTACSTGGSTGRGRAPVV